MDGESKSFEFKNDTNNDFDGKSHSKSQSKRRSKADRSNKETSSFMAN